MGLADTIKKTVSDGIGEALGYVGSVATDSLTKANEVMTTRNELVSEANKPVDEPKSLMYDPFNVVDQLGYRDRPTGLTYYSLREITRREPVIAGIHQTRINQVANFAHIEEDEREPGYRVKLRDKDAHSTPESKKQSEWFEQLLLSTGVTRGFGKDSFETFLKKGIRDSLTFDQLNFEIVHNRKHLPADFYATDAATIRIADVPPGAEVNQDPGKARYVQIYDDVVIAEFTDAEMCFGIRNPRTDLRVNGYGMGELEMLINTVTALLWGFEYNKKFFSQGSVTKGLLNFKGTMPTKKLEQFKRYWYQLITGVANSWRTPIVNAEDVQYINMHSSNRDMEFGEWINFLIKLAAGVYQFDPSEINFQFGNTGQNSPMYQTGTEQRIKHSKDRGLRPVLRSIQEWINRYVIWPIDPDFKLVFTGLDPRSAEQNVDLAKKKTTFLLTVDEARAQEDLEPLPDGKGEVILDPTWLQFSQGKDMAEQGFGQGEDGGYGPNGQNGNQGGDSKEEDSGESDKDEGQVEEEKAKEGAGIKKSMDFINHKDDGDIVTYEISI